MTAKSVPMQYEDKFNALAKAAEVTDEETQIAKFFWYAGLRHAFQRGTSSPALLEKPAPFFNISKEKREQSDSQFGTEMTIPLRHNTSGALGVAVTGGSFWESTMQQYTDDRTLTPYEAKLMQLVLSDMLSELQDEIKGFQTYISFLWKNCNPEDKRTEETYREMNRMKDLVRTTKKHVATLNNAQRKLKKLAKGT